MSNKPQEPFSPTSDWEDMKKLRQKLEDSVSEEGYHKFFAKKERDFLALSKYTIALSELLEAKHAKQYAQALQQQSQTPKEENIYE